MSLVPESAMPYSSNTKTFTAAEALLLAERRQLDLDAPLSTYLSDPHVRNGVTARQALNMRGGIPNLTTPAAEAVNERIRSNPNRHWTSQEALALWPTPTGPPGAGEYSNGSFLTVGAAIEGVAGSSLAAAMRRDLFRPAGLARVAFQDEERVSPPIAAARVGADGADVIPHGGYPAYRSIASFLGAAGAMAGDAPTLARWGYMLYGGHVLSEASTAALTVFDDAGWGLGTRSFDVGTQKGVGQNTQADGYASVIIAVPRIHTSIAILAPAEVDLLPFVHRLVAAGRLAGRACALLWSRPAHDSRAAGSQACVSLEPVASRSKPISRRPQVVTRIALTNLGVEAST